jgi:hypothetical protein
VKTPEIVGKPISIEFRADPHAFNGKLLSGSIKGSPVHAGSFLRRRIIVLDRDLRNHPRELDRILTHELFHFVWLRLGNPLRRSYEDLLRGEVRRHARGEAAWSAENLKRCLRPADVAKRTRRWREYCCESFCDSAALMYMSGSRHRENTLARSHVRRRRTWFAEILGDKTLTV